MKSVIRYLFFFFFFWYIVFFACRIIFLISVFSFAGASIGSSVHGLFAGWLLDLSTIGYCAALPALLSVVYFLTQKKWIAILNDCFVILLIILYCLTASGELCLYQEWRTKLNMQALLHFSHPAEVFQSATFKLTFLFFLLAIVLCSVFIALYCKRFAVRNVIAASRQNTGKQKVSVFVFLLMFLSFDIIIIRGGFKAIPISESDAYYSPNRTLNDAAVNPAWNLVHQIREYSRHKKENPYLVMSDQEADSVMKELFYTEKDSTEKILTTPKPNIVFLILESYSSYEIPAFGGDPYSLFFDSLTRDGLAFTNCYASAYVSDQGIPAILSGYPSSPRVAIINQITKSVNLPCISKDLKPLGYESGFYFGGQLNYGNIKSYLYNMQFDEVKEHDDFPSGSDEGKLGIHDRPMAKLFTNGLNKAKEPFVYCWFTISSHSPYDIPEKIKPLIDHRENDYVNTIIYTDEAMRDFFTEAKKQPWFKNTLFVIVADHSHNTQRDFRYEDKEYHHIPLLFYGDVIKPEYRGRKIKAVFSQLDIAPTLLGQLSVKHDQYVFAKDVLNPYAKHFAFYYFFDGTGFITDTCYASFSKDKNILWKTNCSDSAMIGRIKHFDQSYLQKEYEDYLNR